MTLEIEAIRLFVRREKHDRFVGFVSNERKRGEFLWALQDPAIFDPRCVTKVSGGERSVERLTQLYRSLGMGGRVYAISPRSEWDGQKFQMTYLLEQTLAQCDDVLAYCWQTRTAFYEWHHSGTSYFLRSPG